MALKPGQLFSFGPFRVDPRERRLTKDGNPVSLTPKAFDTLLCLLENAGSLVTRQELMAQVWPDTFIEDVTLTRNISDLRKALGEGYIETVPRHGYRFVGLMSTVEPSATSENPPEMRRPMRPARSTILPGSIFVLLVAFAAAAVWSNRAPNRISSPVIRSELARQPATRLTASPEAYELYAKGRYFWNKRTSEGFHKAIESFQAAIAKDPTYALAYGGLADSQLLLAGYRMESQQKMIPLARAAAKKALELDSACGEAHRTLALIAQNYDLDWDQAAAEYKLALHLNPEDATTHAWYGEFLGIRGYFDDGLRELAIAHQIDPLSLVIMTDTAKILHYAGRTEEAIAWCRKALELDPGFQRAHLQLSGIYETNGQPQAALQELLKVGEDPNFVLAIARIRAEMGERTAAEQELRRISSNSGAPSSLFDLAIFYLMVGDRQRALDCMEQASARHDIGVIAFKTDPLFRSLRDEPRYRKLLKALKL